MINFGKFYQITDEDYSTLAQKAGVPKNYEQLYLCDDNYEDIVGKVIDGITRAFTTGEVVPWGFMKDGHIHFFVRVQGNCNTNVQESITRNSSLIIDLCPYILQEKNPPHKMGKSSWSIIFQNQLKS